MLKRKLHCVFTGEDYDIVTDGGRYAEKHESHALYVEYKGKLQYSSCPLWGECPYNDNMMSCSSFNDMPKRRIIS